MAGAEGAAHWKEGPVFEDHVNVTRHKPLCGVDCQLTLAYYCQADPMAQARLASHLLCTGPQWLNEW